MALKIRLRQQGRTNRKMYRLVVTPSTSAREGKYIEMLGWYNPHETEASKQLSIQKDRIEHWLSAGAMMTEKAEALIKKQAPEVIKTYHQKCVTRKLKRNAKKRAKTKAA